MSLARAIFGPKASERLWSSWAVIAYLVLGHMLIACTSGPPLSPERRLQIACSSYADTLSALATRNRLGLLSKAAQSRVDDAVIVIAPVCEGVPPSNPGILLTRVEASLVVMLEERNRVD